MSEAKTEVDLQQETDAMVWAEEFMRLFGDRRDEIDAGLMVGWFANAMGVGERQAENRESAMLRRQAEQHPPGSRFGHVGDACRAAADFLSGGKREQ